ncbi:hypothetical protein J4429_04810 [Candidatus Pacearchaeota archaeon]|nr:hypothetical protein [Candidatus Pacearchaeota archaeon]
MKNKLVNGLSALAVSTAALLNSGCEMCGEPAYYEYPSYYQPAPCFQQPQYFQQIPCQPIYNGNQTVSPTPIYNGNRINKTQVRTIEPEAEPAMPPKPIPEEILTPEPIKPSNLKSIKPINKTA